MAREVFTRFKQYALDADQHMLALLAQVDRSAQVYRSFVERGEDLSGPVDRLGLFAYRTGVMESEVIKPLVLFLFDPEQTRVPAEQLTRSLEAIESWMVRRMLVRATTKSYTQFVAELITHLRGRERSRTGDNITEFLASQTSDSRYWPDDDEIREELRILPAHRRLQRGRLRMVLKAVEDHLRGWRGERPGLGGERVTRAKFHIEHVLPRKWQTHWPLSEGPHNEGEREALIDTIGNLTLLTKRLHAKVSNGPWLGAAGKRHALEGHDILFLNRELLKLAGDRWTDAAIRARSATMARLITEIWPVPEGHRSGTGRGHTRPKHKVDLSDLLSAGCVRAGMPLYPRSKKFGESTATLLADGRLDSRGIIYSTPSQAATAIVGKNMNGWRFFLVDRQSRRSLKDVRLEYLASMAGDADDEPEDDADDKS